MRGFLVGTFALVVLSAFVQRGAADNLSKGTSAAADAFRRLTDPNVAGVPLRAGVAGKTAPSSGGSTSGLASTPTPGASSPTFVTV